MLPSTSHGDSTHTLNIPNLDILKCITSVTQYKDPAYMNNNQIYFNITNTTKCVITKSLTLTWWIGYIKLEFGVTYIHESLKNIIDKNTLTTYNSGRFLEDYCLQT